MATDTKGRGGGGEGGREVGRERVRQKETDGEECNRKLFTWH